MSTTASNPIPNPRFPTLAQPLKLGSIQCRNRTIMASLTRNRNGTPQGNSIPNADVVEHYRQRAVGGIGLILSEGILVNQQGTEWKHAPGLWSEDHMKGWKEVVDVVHKENCPIVMQIWHVGRVAHPEMEEQVASGKPVYAPSAIAARGGKFREIGNKPNATPTAVPDPKTILADYRHSAELALQAGFDGIELHSANGYLVHQFLDSTSNTRTDQYGGSRENRCRFGLEALKILIDVFGADRVGIKINPCAGYNDVGMDKEEQVETYKYYVGELDKLGLAYIQMVRYVDKMDPEYDGKKRAIQHDVYQTYSPVIKNTPLLMNGMYTGPEAEKTIHETSQAGTAVQGIVFGVPTISNPDLYERIQLGVDLDEVENPKGFYVGVDGINAKGYNDYHLSKQTASGKREHGISASHL